MSYIAFFDMDGTLLTTHTGGLFFRYSYNMGKIKLPYLIKIAPVPILYSLGLIDLERISKKMGMRYKGQKDDEMNAFIDEWFSEMAVKYMRNSMFSEIKYHKDRGAKTVMISASPRNFCRPVVEYFKLDDLICTELVVKNGYITGECGMYCYGENKVIMAEEYCVKNNFSLKESWFYSDSESDIPLLKKVGNPICVKPDKKLMKYARDNNWKII